ncbi:MAG: Hsp20 family protein [Rhodospirillaceae bacterium]|nr:Hsp20 family protein [Rhodospirillaceae bacterium]
MLNSYFVPRFRAVPSVDRLFDLFDAQLGIDAAVAPAHDIEKLDDDHYRISVAVPGFRRDDLNVETKGDLLVVSGRKETAADRKLVHRGIGLGNFEQRFSLADHVRVEGATVVDGVLSIDLVREIPEEKKPRRIEIGVAPEGLVDKAKKLVGLDKAA